MVIHLGTLLPGSSCDLPEAESLRHVERAIHLSASYLVLLHMGFAVPLTVTGGAVRSYRTLSPLPTDRSRKAVYSLLHFPSRRRASPLASMLLIGVRTFLCLGRQRPSEALRPKAFYRFRALATDSGAIAAFVSGGSPSRRCTCSKTRPPTTGPRTA